MEAEQADSWVVTTALLNIASSTRTKQRLVIKQPVGHISNNKAVNFHFLAHHPRGFLMLELQDSYLPVGWVPLSL